MEVRQNSGLTPLGNFAIVRLMKVTGIIAEYNPFHNGHLGHLKEARRETGADYLIAAMGGDFTQRGAPALIDKFTRAAMALSCGIDLVLEIPVIHATGSASYFAHGAVALLDNLQVVDALCFGSEGGSPEAFQEAGQLLRQEPPTFQESLRACLSMGHTFPAARQQALFAHLGQGHKDGPSLMGLLQSPNNILGLEYCMALQDFGSPMRPVPIPRQGAAHHQAQMGARYSSATAIRQAIRQGTPFSAWSGHIPAPAAQILGHALQDRGWLCENDFSLLLKYKCMETPPEQLCRYFDVSGEMANRIHNCLNEFTNYQEFIPRIKTSGITYTRAARGLLHILLGLGSPAPAGPGQPPSAVEASPYARVLGFRKDSAALLSEIKKASRIPLVTRPAKFLKGHPGKARQPSRPRAHAMLGQDIHASNLYETVLAYKSHTPFTHEASKAVVIV